MRAKSLTLILGLACSMIISLYTFWVLKELENYYLFGVILSILIFSLFFLYSFQEGFLTFGSLSSFTLLMKFSEYTIYILWILAVLVVILVMPPSSLTYFLPWNELPLQVLFRLIAVFLLTSFYPGFGLLRLMIRQKKLSLFENVILSLLVSIFISSIIAFFALVCCNSLQIAFYIILAVNLLFMSSMMYSLRKPAFEMIERAQALRVEFPTIFRALTLVSIIAFIFLSVYSVNFPDKFIPTIDQWYHYGRILKVFNGNFFNFIHSYYFYYMYPSLYIYCSHAPFINAYMTLFVLIPLPVLSFYLMLSKFLDEKRRIVATLVYAFFSGFGGIYTDYLRIVEGKDINSALTLASAKTYDIFATVGFSYYLFPKILGFTTFFILIYFIYDSKISGFSKTLLWGIVFAEGFLFHIVEIYIILLLLIYLILLYKDDISHAKEVFLGNILGFIIISTIDFVSPQKLYLFSYMWTGKISLTQLAFLGIIMGMPLLYYSGIKFSFLNSTRSYLIKKLFLFGLLFTFYVLCLSIIIWISVLPQFNIYRYEILYSYFVWYLYPIKLGIALLLSIFGVYQLFEENNNKVLRFSLGIILISIILERLMSYFRIMNLLELSVMDPGRILDFTWVGVAILASPVLGTLLGQISFINFNPRLTQREITRKLITTCLLIILIIAGVSSTLYSIEMRSANSALKVTKSELDAIEFLDTVTPPNATVLALGRARSVNKINSFSGRYPVLYYQPAIFGASYLETFADIMKNNAYELFGHSQIKYFWLTPSDEQELYSYKDSYFLNYALKNLPILYKSNNVTVVVLPSFYPPSSNSDIVAVKSLSNNCQQTLLLTAIAMAGLNYTVRYDFDIPERASTLILPSNLVDNVLKDIEHAKVKRIVIFNIDGSLDNFTHLLNIYFNPNIKQIANGIKGSNIEVSLSPIEVPVFNSTDENTETLAFYTRNGQLISSYAFRKIVNSREIIYVMLYPILQLLCNNIQNKTGSSIFTNLGILIKVVNLQSMNYQSSKVWGRAILFGSSILEGDIVIRPISFYIPAIDSKRANKSLKTSWVKDSFQTGWSMIVSNPKKGFITIEGTGDILTVNFEAYEKNVFEYFFLKTPMINVSQTPFLVVREMIKASDFNFGYLRIVAGNYTYVVRGWDADTTAPGHMWKTYVFDLTKAIPERKDAPMPIKAPISAIYWTGYSTAEKGGRAKLYIDYIGFTDSPLYLINSNKTFASLNLTEAQSILINGVSNVEKTINRIQILDFHALGDVNVTFLSKKTILLPPGLGLYSKIVFPEGCTIVFSLNNSSQINFTILRDAKTFNVTVTGGKIYLNLFSLNGDLEIYMNNPQIEVNGSAFFEKAFISWPYNIYNPGFPMNASGNIHYKVNAMDNSFSLISEFNILGTYKIITQSQIRWNEWDIPWSTVITSPYHSLLIGVIIVLYYAYLKKRMFNSSKDLI